MAARKERAGWVNADAHIESSPEAAFCVCLLSNARADLVKFSDAAARFREAQEAAKNVMSWMYREEADLPFDMAAAGVGRDPNALREAMLKGIDANLVRMCMGGMNWVCPVCGGKH
jgi:rubrerythrin